MPYSASTQMHLWGSPRTDEPGRELENFIMHHNLILINKPLEYLAYAPHSTTFVDVTLMGHRATLKVAIPVGPPLHPFHDGTSPAT